MTPLRDWYRYEHTCSGCRYIGTGHVNGEQTDWWLCRDETVVGRTGDKPHEYWSMPVAMLIQASENGSTYATAARHQPDVARLLPGPGMGEPPCWRRSKGGRDDSTPSLCGL